MKANILLCSLFLSVTAFVAMGQEVKMPDPALDAEASLKKALENRRSEREYVVRPLDLQTMSNLLWAGWGYNRDDTYYENGAVVTPEEPNAVKLEAFIFDALPLASRTMILEADRKECFAPTKNKTGVDSVESCREMLAARDARRLRLAGIQVPEGAVVELSPRDVFDDEDAANFFRNLVPTAYGR